VPDAVVSRTAAAALLDLSGQLGALRADRDALAAQRAAALALHAPQTICELYGETCDDHRDEPPDPLPGIDAPDPYDTHGHHAVCAHCCCDPDGDQSPWCAEYHAGPDCWPCPTAAALGAEAAP